MIVVILLFVKDGAWFVARQKTRISTEKPVVDDKVVALGNDMHQVVMLLQEAGQFFWGPVQGQKLWGNVFLLKAIFI